MSRFAASVLIVAVLAVLAACAPGAMARGGQPPPTSNRAADQSKSVTLLFMPGPVRTPQPVMASQVQQLPGFAIGLFSPTLGRYSPTQMMLDISQGARVASSLYLPVVAPPPGLVANRIGARANAGHFLQWPGLVRRADRVPGDVVPGLLGGMVDQSGARSVWISQDGSPTISAIAAADRRGVVGRLRLVPGGVDQLRAALVQAQLSAELVVGSIPAGGYGLGVARALASAQPNRLIIVVQAPPEPARTRLLTIGLRGIGGEGGIISATTRRNGLVAATDVAPTILDRLGIALPKGFQGQPIEGASRQTPEQLNEMNSRLALVAGRRAPLGRDVFVLGALIVLLLLLLGRLGGRFAEIARLTQRVAALAMLWLPLLLLLTAYLRPSRSTEADVVVVGSLLLALVTDRLVRWPRALIVPVAAVLTAHGLDFLLLGGRLTGESLLGSNPLYGARFFGVGNELEAVLTVSCVLGVGSALSDSRARRPARWFAAAGVILAFFLGAGRLGADVGGVIFAGAAFGVAAVYVSRMRITPLRVAAIVLLPILGLALIAGLDTLTGGESHLTRTVVEAQSFGDLWKVAERRLSASIEGGKAGGVWIVMIVALAALIAGWFRREQLCARLSLPGEDPLRRRAYRAGLAGALAGTVIGALANDSGPAILIIGTIYTGMGVLYLRGRPISGKMEAYTPPPTSNDPS